MNTRITPPIKTYFSSILIFMLGGGVSVWMEWEWFLWLSIVAGVVMIGHSFTLDVFESYRQMLQERNYGWDSVAKMDPEARYAFGLTSVAESVKVVVDKTGAEGNEFSQTWRNLPILPWKMKIIAQACLSGTPFTVRQWSGDGKLLSDDQYEELQNALLELNFLEPKSEKDRRQGFRWTEPGLDMLKQCVDAPLR
jgi:hypothetical protein